jgi:hypothetical protein
MSKYNTFKYKQGKYGFWVAASGSLTFKRRYRANGIITETIEVNGINRVRIRSDREESFTVVTVVPLDTAFQVFVVLS